MKKILALLWIVILTGTVFISIRFFKPNSAPQDDAKLTDPTIATTAIDIPKITEEPIKAVVEEKIVREIPAEVEGKSYQELITEADDYLSKLYIDKAIKTYIKALALNPNSADSLIKLGKAYLQNNQTAQAKEKFALAATLEPTNYAQVLLAKANLDLRETEEAKKIIWALDETNAQVKYYKGIISILQKDHETAQKLFDQIIKSNPPASSDLREKSQKYLTAYTTFSYFKESEQVFLNLMLAKVMTDTDESQAAIPLLFSIINEKNNYRDAWLVLGYAYLKTGQANEAADALLQAKALNENDPKTLFYLGLAYFANQDIDSAILYIEAADKAGFEPKDQIKLKLADLYLIKNDYKKSAKNYEEVLVLNPKNIEIFVRAVWLNLDKVDQEEKALALAESALKHHPKNAMSYNLVGWAQTTLGNYDKAEEFLDKALAMNPKLDAANLNYAWLKQRQGKTETAKEYYKKAFILGQGNSIGNLAAIRFNELEKKIPRT